MKIRVILVMCAIISSGIFGGFILAPTPVAASPADPASPSGGSGPGLIETPDGSGRIVSWQSTFLRWDGTWRPYQALNWSTGDWPYRITDVGDALTAQTSAGSLTQGKVPGATYDFPPTGVKEVINLTSASLVPVDGTGALGLIVPFATDLTAAVEGTSVALRDSAGTDVWRTAPFLAWDSADPRQVYAEPVTSVDLRPGSLVLALNASMLAQALQPLYLDPTWTLANWWQGWGSSTFQDVVEDLGEGTVKIGWFADNFNDNANEAWTVEAGTATFEGGVMSLQESTAVRAGSSLSDQRLGFKVRFTAGGTAQAYFRYQDADNHYVLDLSEAGDSLTLKKKVAGSSSTIATVTGVTIAVGTDYWAVLSASGDAFTIRWQGADVWSGADGSPPSAPLSGVIRFATGSSAMADLDEIRVWNTSSGTMTTVVRDAGLYVALETYVGAYVDAYNQVHVRIRSSPNNATWGPWTNVKSDMASQVYHQAPDQDRQRYYMLQVILTSGDDGTPVLWELTTNEGSPPAISPSANTGFESWYPSVGGLVNPVNGNVWYSTRDLSVRARAFDITIVRSYNSLRGSEAGPLGNGWTHNYNEKLVVNGDLTVTWNDADGSQHIFTPKGTTGGYAPPRGVTDRLVKNGDNTYALWRQDGSRETFDTAGQMTSIVDKNGNRVTLTYASGRLTTIADDSGMSLTFTYDGSNRIISVHDPINRYWNYSYDGSGNLNQSKDPMGFRENYTYSGGKLATIVDPVGRRTAFTYDGSNRATEIWLGFYRVGQLEWQFREYEIAYGSGGSRTVTNARGFTTTITLNSFGNPTQVTGPPVGTGGCACCDHRGNTTSYVWDGEGNKIQITDGRGDAWSYDFDHRSRLASRTDPGGNVSSQAWSEINSATRYIGLLMNGTNFRGYKTSYTYDTKGNLLTTTDAVGSIAYRTYTSQGFLATSKDFRGYETNYTYDAHGWLTQVRNPGGNVTMYDYDAVGRQRNATTPLGFTTSSEYDADDRRTKMTDPLGNFTLYGYNTRGDLVQVTDANGNVTQYEVNVTSRKLSKATEAGGNVSLSSYDLRSNLVRFTNPRGFNEKYAYDGYDRVTTETRPGGNATTYTYDAAGNTASRLDANGNLTTYGWDTLNRLNRITYPGGVVLTGSYDANGNTLQASGFGYTRTEVWDALDRRKSTTWNYGSFAKTLSYQYDADSHRSRMNYSDGTYLTYAWDSVGRLNKTTYSDGSTWWFGYDADDRRTNLTYPNGVVTSWQYDGASRITEVSTEDGSSVLESFTYEYDKVGNRIRMTEEDGSWVRYAYDVTYRLEQELYDDVYPVNYRYDANGNRLTLVEGLDQQVTYTLRPSANAGVAWSQSPTSGQNFDKVDEATSDGDNTYVYAPMGSCCIADEYDFQDVPEIPGGVIDSVKVVAVARYSSFALAPRRARASSS